MFVRDISKPAGSEARGEGRGRGNLPVATAKPPVARRLVGNCPLTFVCCAWFLMWPHVFSTLPHLENDFRTCYLLIPLILYQHVAFYFRNGVSAHVTRFSIDAFATSKLIWRMFLCVPCPNYRGGHFPSHQHAVKGMSYISQVHVAIAVFR